LSAELHNLLAMLLNIAMEQITLAQQIKTYLMELHVMITTSALTPVFAITDNALEFTLTVLHVSMEVVHLLMTSVLIQTLELQFMKEIHV